MYRSDMPDTLGSATDVVRVFEWNAGATSGVWFTASKMTQRRAFHSVAVWRTHIFAVGGEDDSKTYDTNAELLSSLVDCTNTPELLLVGI